MSASEQGWNAYCSGNYRNLYKMGGGDVIALVNPGDWNVEPQLAYANGWNAAIQKDFEAYRDAIQLSEFLHSEFYSDVKQWKPLEDVRGVISQIDNMIAGKIMTWQPIKTAPKDGTKILLSCPARGEYPGVVEKCYWHVWGSADGKWWDWVCPDKPTRWMPLPSPPK